MKMILATVFALLVSPAALGESALDTIYANERAQQDKQFEDIHNAPVYSGSESGGLYEYRNPFLTGNETAGDSATDGNTYEGYKLKPDENGVLKYYLNRTQ